MKKEDFNKKLKTLFKQTGVKKIDLHSKEVFSYASPVNYISLFKKRVDIVVTLFSASLALQLIALFFYVTVPEPRYFMTTFNGHVYEIQSPRPSLEEAVKVNNAIEGSRKIITTNVE